jgi:hypothetical protein
MITQAVHGVESFCDLSVLHEPTGRLGTEKDAEHEDEGRNEGGAELKTPCDSSSVFYDNVGAEAEEYTYI